MPVVLDLVYRELLVLPRRRRFYQWRLLLVAVGSAAVLGQYHLSTQAASGAAGLLLFAPLVRGALLAVCLAAAHAAADSLVREKEGGTLGLLLISDLSSWQLVASRLAAVIVRATLLILSFVPLMLLCVSLGGVSTVQVLAAMGLMVVTAVTASCLGLGVGIVAPNAQVLQGLLTLVMALAFIVLPAGVSLLGQLLAMQPEAWVQTVSPFVLMETIIYEESRGWGLVRMAVPVLTVLPLLPLVSLALRPVARGRRNLPSWVERLLEVRRPAAPKSRKPVQSNPVYWREWHRHGMTQAQSWFRCLSLVLGMLLLVTASWYFLEFPEIGAWERVETHLVANAMALAGGMCALFYVYGLVARYSRAFDGDLQLMDVLMLSDLHGLEFVAGKTRAIAHTLLPWAITALTCLIVALWLEAGSWFAVVFCLLAGVFVLNMLQPFCYLLLWLSLKRRRNVTVLALIGLVFWLSLGSMLVLLVAGLLALPTLGLAYLIVPFWLPMFLGRRVRRRVIEEFRQLALAEG